MTKKLIVVTITTTIRDWPRRATSCRRIRERESARAEPDAIPFDPLRRVDGPASHVHGPAVGSRQADVDAAVYRVDEYDVIQPDRRNVVGDRLERSPRARLRAVGVERGGRGVEQRIDRPVRIPLHVPALIADSGGAPR